MSSPSHRTSLAPLFAQVRGRNNEGIVGIAIIILVLAVGSMDTSFWSLSTVFNVFRNSYEPLVFALGVFLILLIGGIDVSFDAIGIFSAYAVAVLAAGGAFGNSLWLMFLIAMLLGLGLGLVNALIVAAFRLPVLIVTLGTRGVFAGVMLVMIGSNFISDLPPSVSSFGTSFLLSTESSSGRTSGLQILIIPIAIVCVLLAMGLRYTVIGRGVFAIGGDEEAARRAGFPVGMIKTIVFCCAGMLAGAAGMIHVSLIGFANPQDLVGGELIVIAAVVLGGASIFGGRGSVIGTILGVLLIEVIQYSLITLGIPSAWDDVAVGVLLLAGLTMQVAHLSGGTSRRRLRREIASGGKI